MHFSEKRNINMLICNIRHQYVHHNYIIIIDIYKLIVHEKLVLLNKEKLKTGAVWIIIYVKPQTHRSTLRASDLKLI